MAFGGLSGNERALLLAFQDGLRKHGLIEGQNISIEYRWAAGNLDRLPSLAAELVELQLDVIVTAPASSGVVVRRLMSTIPIVLATSGDPVIAGLAESLPRPGGNVTGALLVTTDPLLSVHLTRILAAVATMRLPAMYGLREFVDGGGLVSYGVSLRENFRQAASYVAKILDGKAPGELPIERPTAMSL